MFRAHSSCIIFFAMNKVSVCGLQGLDLGGVAIRTHRLGAPSPHWQGDILVSGKTPHRLQHDAEAMGIPVSCRREHHEPQFPRFLLRVT